MLPHLLRRAAPALLLITALSLTGCAPPVSVPVADEATDPLCAEVLVRLPTAVEEQAQRVTDSQATAAWGSPAAILLRCGVTSDGPAILPCVTVDGIDWLRDETGAPDFVYTTFGREPAVEVIVDGTRVTPAALTELAPAIAVVPATRKCTASPNE